MRTAGDLHLIAVRRGHAELLDDAPAPGSARGREQPGAHNDALTWLYALADAALSGMTEPHDGDGPARRQTGAAKPFLCLRATRTKADEAAVFGFLS